MHRLLAASLLTVVAAGSVAAAPSSLKGSFDTQGYFEVVVDGKKVKKMTGSPDLIKVLGDQVPAGAAPRCPSRATVVHYDRYLSKLGMIFLCDGAPKAGHIYNGAYYESTQMKGAIVINDEPGLQRLIGWPVK